MEKYVNTLTQKIKTDQGHIFAYREIGNPVGIPLIALTHLSGNLDNWDPTVIDGIAVNHHVILPDYLGVGASLGPAATSIQAMATDMIEFIHQLGYPQIDLFGFSMGGFVAQEIMAQEPGLVHRAILTGTGPRGGKGIENVTRISDVSLLKAIFTFRDVKTYLFFTRTLNGKQESKAFLNRIKSRTHQRDKGISWPAYRKQLTAIHRWASEAPIDFSNATFPVLIANGENDIMVPTKPNSIQLAKSFQHSKLVLYPDAGHAGVFQYAAAFVKEVNQFLLA
ncbi:alpha/beta fold hydrolase [Agrilactobacillus yilanensis]|uniref:Alpha/beta fold hydrolase n=1 Tax=Agrilactobacillus yilanensis TaxID=2485997 RepID=A0ABW4J3G0_9LACO|nr:alpha/beta hydrolase [Agrilactobacillus yilanensis]